SRSFVFSQRKISSILSSTRRARLRLSFGATSGLPLIRKLIKPIKVAPSCFSDEVRRYELVVAKAESQVRAAHASVPRKPNAAVRIEVPRLNLVYRCFYQPAKFLTLLVGNRGPQVLHLGSMLSHKDNQRGFGNSGDPRITDQLGIK